MLFSLLLLIIAALLISVWPFPSPEVFSEMPIEEGELDPEDPQDPEFKAKLFLQNQTALQLRLTRARKELFDLYQQPVEPFDYRSLLHHLKSRRVLLLTGKKDIHLLQILLRKEPYTNYTGLTGFDAYQELPMSWHSVAHGRRQLKDLLKRHEFDLCLFAWEHMSWREEERDMLKEVMTSDHLQTLKAAQYLDLGPGILALTGCVSLKRPRFRNWVNFRLQSYTYKFHQNVEFMPESAVIITPDLHKVMWMGHTQHAAFVDYLKDELGYTVERGATESWKELYIFSTLKFQSNQPPFSLTDIQPGVLCVTPTFVACSSRWVWKLFVDRPSGHYISLKNRLEPHYVQVIDKTVSEQN